MWKIVNDCENCERLWKIVKRCENCEKSKNFENCEYCENSENCENCEKSWKIVRIVKDLNFDGWALFNPVLVALMQDRQWVFDNQKIFKSEVNGEV